MAHEISRRQLLFGGLAGAAILGADKKQEIIDIHQHTHYAGRSDETLIAHQRAMGITKTVLLPAGSKLGLDADCYGNDSVVALAKRYPKEFVYFANEAPDLPKARA